MTIAMITADNGTVYGLSGDDDDKLYVWNSSIKDWEEA